MYLEATPFVQVKLPSLQTLLREDAYTSEYILNIIKYVTLEEHPIKDVQVRIINNRDCKVMTVALKPAASKQILEKYVIIEQMYSIL